MSLETARRGLYSREPARWIETCTCPEGYVGQYCESCAPGYRHSPANGGPFASCIPCDCNNHAEICDSETGRWMPGDCYGVVNYWNSVYVYFHIMKTEKCIDVFIILLYFLAEWRRSFKQKTVNFITCPCIYIWFSLCWEVSFYGVNWCFYLPGRCICQHNTAGDQCERCDKGYYGNALRGEPNDCTPCPCPNNGACTQLPDDTVVCLGCPTGYAGEVLIIYATSVMYPLLQWTCQLFLLQVWKIKRVLVAWQIEGIPIPPNFICQKTKNYPSDLNKGSVSCIKD